MTQGPPSTAASSSKALANGSGGSQQPTLPTQHAEPTSAAWDNAQGPIQYPTGSPRYTIPDPHYAHPGPPMTHYPNVMSGNPYASHLSFGATQYAPFATPAAAQKNSIMPVENDLIPPLPDPETYKSWDEIVKKFLVRAKFLQTLKGFETDMLLLNDNWEQEVIPEALAEMMKGLQTILDRVSGKKQADENMDVDITSTDPVPDKAEEPTLEDRKLEYISSATGLKLQSHSSINKSISQFLAKTRSRNDASNRAEFLFSLAEKKRKLQEEGVDLNDTQMGSCARADAKPVDRDKQVKYDIAKYGEGPLTKTAKVSGSTMGASHSAAYTVPQKRKAIEIEIDRPKMKKMTRGKERFPSQAELEEDQEEALITEGFRPGLEERFRNVEDHLGIRYVPCAPRTMFRRMKYLEEHITKLEQEYPPWAALHFNQPSRGWPPPPRATPIILPAHHRTLPPVSPTEASATVSDVSANSSQTMTPALPGLGKRKVGSSLQRAVLNRLEVQKAMNEMNEMNGTQQGR